ncbi:MAG: Lrp/AsnC family transcriptional regulator [Desulfitobacteriia bacterium]|jgi:Lrp/AsnC family leucine-responsive transcriptional regulator
MDDIDQRIIEMLLENSRMSYVDMGKVLGLSRVAVRERVKNLQEQGIIQDFTITLNQEKMGKKVSAFFNIEVEPYYFETIAKELARNPHVVSIYQMTGPSTLHVHAVLKDMESLEHFIYRKLYSQKGIKKVENQVLLRRFKSRGGIRP